MADLVGGLYLVSPTEPLRLGYDDTGTTDIQFEVSAAGQLTVTPTSGQDIVLGSGLLVMGQLNVDADATFDQDVDITGNVGVGAVNVTDARLKLAAGSASLVPLLLVAGVLKTAPLDGGIEYDGSNYYATVGASRREILLADAATGRLTHADLPAGSGTWDYTGGNLTLSGAKTIIDTGTTATAGILLSQATELITFISMPSPQSPGGSVTPLYSIHSVAGSASISITRWNNAGGANSPTGLTFTRSRTNTLADAASGTRTIVNSTDSIGNIVWTADDGTNLFTHVAAIYVAVGGTPSTNRIPGRMLFRVAQGAADDDIAQAMELSPDGILSISANITPITTLGRGLEVAKATGSATIEPAYIRIRSTTNAADWSVTDPWGALNFYSGDASGIGANTRARLGAVFENTAGSLTRLGFWVSDTSALTLRFVVGSGGDIGVDATKRLYMDGVALTGNTYLAESSADVLDAVAGATIYRFTTTALRPGTNDVGSLGISGTAWADLFLASGGIINWSAGNVTLTHAAGQLTLGGSHLLFSADNSQDIGASGATRPRRVYVGTGLQIGTRPDYTVTNPTTNRSLDVTGATLGQLAQVVGTVIQDFIDREVFQ